MTAPGFKTIPPTHAWRNLNTLQKLWAGVYLVWALDVLFLIASLAGAQVHRGAMRVVGKDAAPSIIHAQHIKAALADMDADAASELLVAPGQVLTAVKAYESRRKEAATALIEAAKNITYPGEQEPVEAIQVALGTYEVKIQRARDLRSIGEPSYIDAYRDAAQVMDRELLPRADEMDKVNLDQLEATYSRQSARSLTSIFFLLLAGALLTATLVAIQKFLNRMTHRMLNPMLVLATLVTLAFLLYTFYVLGAERHQLKVAKEDAFESIHALWRARAVAYAANTDVSRYLLDVAHAEEHDRNFLDRSAELTGAPVDRMLEAAQKNRTVEGGGYLAKELNNITFPGEKEAAIDTVVRFRDYVDIASRIRSLRQGGKSAEALELCFGTKEGESTGAFDQFDRALGKTLSINQTAFDAAVNAGISDLSYFELKAAVIAAVIALLAFFGLLKRIQEYQ